MKKITKYDILHNTNTVDLYRDVHKLLSLGWQPLGGVAVRTHNEGSSLFQAMVRYEDVEIED